MYNELVTDSMRRDCFDEIMKFSYAAGNTKLPNNDNYGIVYPLMEILNVSFLKYGNYLGIVMPPLMSH